MKYTLFALALYSLSVTGWYQYDKERNESEVVTLERIILQQEKLLMEKEQGELVICSTEMLEEKPERSYTYDQWVSDKPCPPGKDGPLCHMDESDYR